MGKIVPSDGTAQLGPVSMNFFEEKDRAVRMILEA
jgi:hypothetical protein